MDESLKHLFLPGRVQGKETPGVNGKKAKTEATINQVFDFGNVNIVDAMEIVLKGHFQSKVYGAVLIRFHSKTTNKS